MDRKCPCALTTKIDVGWSPAPAPVPGDSDLHRLKQPVATQQGLTRVQRGIFWERFWSGRLEAFKRRLEQDDDAL